MSFAYLASPYSTPDQALRAFRVSAAESAFVWLLQQRIWAYSPIVHCHSVALHYGLETDFETFRDYNFAMIASASEVFVLAIPGWEKSAGVRGEINFAIEKGIPCKVIRGNIGDWEFVEGNLGDDPFPPRVSDYR